MALRTPPVLSLSPLRSLRPLSSLRPARRTFHDLQIPSRTDRPIVRAGPGGRSSSTGHVATVFGCTGFLGRYVVSKLARQGTQVVVPCRDWDDGRHLKVTGDLGVVVPMEVDVKNEEMIAECVRHSDIVYNLIGRDYETKNFSFSDVHVTAAARIARICSKAGVPRLVHVSHLDASPHSQSGFYRSKWEGEQAVAEAYPGATIVRPGPMYGHEDRFINSIATLPWSWRANQGKTLTRPVHVMDVAQALFNIFQAPSTSSNALFTFPGPKIFSYLELLHLFSLHALPRDSLAVGSVPSRALWVFTTSLLERFLWFGGTKLGTDVIHRRWIDDAGTQYDESEFLLQRETAHSAYETLRKGWDPEVLARSRSVPGLSLEDDVGSEQWWKMGAEPPKGMERKSWREIGIDRLDEIEEQMYIYARGYRKPGLITEPVTSGGVKIRQPHYRVIE